MTVPTISVDIEIEGVSFLKVTTFQVHEKTNLIAIFTLEDARSGAAIDLTGKAVRFAAKRSLSDPDEDKIFDVLGVITDPVNGKVRGTFAGSALIRLLGGSFEINVFNDPAPVVGVLPDNRRELKFNIVPSVVLGGANPEEDDIHSFNMPSQSIGASTAVITGTFRVPTGKVVSQVRFGVRRVDDADDADLISNIRNEDTGEELATSLEYPQNAAFGVAAIAGQRLVISTKNLDVTDPVDAFSNVGIILVDA